MRIIPLSEGAFTIDKTKVFVPFNTETETLNSRPVGSLLVEIQPFVIVTDKDVILLDTGLATTMQRVNFSYIPILKKRAFSLHRLPKY
jgi:hypothetical protein